MAIIGIILSFAGLGFICWLLFSVAVYALPFVAGLTVGVAALHAGAGVVGAFIVGLLAGGLTLVLGQVAIGSIRAPLGRAAIGLLYAVPAAIAGYSAALGFAQFGIPSHGWREAFAIFGALLSGATAWARLTMQVALPRGRSATPHPVPSALMVATKGR